MNKFVLMRPESYDEYSIDVAHPILTKYDKEQIQEFLEKEFERRKPKWTEHTYFKILDSNLYISYLQLQEYMRAGEQKGKYCCRKIEILTLEEWFEKYTKEENN